MKAIVHANGMPHQRVHAAAMVVGLQRHGIEARLGAFNDPEPCDFAVVWGARQWRVFETDRPVLVMERGHVGDRMSIASLGWGWIGRRGRYPKAADGGARWRERHGELMKPWRIRDGYALILGQVPGDAALGGLDVATWASDTARTLNGYGYRVRFRPHPLAERWAPVGTVISTYTLASDLAGAAVAVTYNSTAGVEAVLAGVPTVTIEPGAMAWPVAGHAVGELVMPDREAWAHDLAWSQWTLDEIAAGDPWPHLAPLMEANACPA